MARKAVKRAAARRAVKKRAVKRAVVKRAVKKRAVKRAVVKRAVKKRAVKRAVVKRAVKKRAVKRAVAKRALKRAIVKRAIRRAILSEALATGEGRGFDRVTSLRARLRPGFAPRPGRASDRAGCRPPLARRPPSPRSLSPSRFGRTALRS